MRRLTHQHFVAIVALLGVSACTAQAQLSTNYDGSTLAGFPGYNAVSNYIPLTYFGTASGAIYSLKLMPLTVQYETNPSPTLTNYNAELTAEYGNKYNIVYNTVATPQVLNNNPGNNNSLVVKQYAVQTSPAGTFGANLWLTYNNALAGNPNVVPAAGANQNGQHWLQVINDNWNISGATQGPGVPENIVDVPAGQADPYYDVGYAANSTYFFDAPRRLTAPLTGQTIFWTAEDFIVNQTAAYNPVGNVKGTINVYGGVVYGFIATTPEPGAYAYGLVLLGTSLGLLRRRRAKR